MHLLARAAALTLVLAGVLAAFGIAQAAGPSVDVVQPHRTFGAGPLRSVLARAAGPEPRLLVLGDSVPAGTACNCDAFGNLLARSVADDRGGAVALVNDAAPGLTTGGLLDQLSSGSLDDELASTTFVSVTIGANDFDPALIGEPGCDGGGRIDCYSGSLAQFSTIFPQVLQQLARRLPPTGRIAVSGYWNVFRDGAVGQALGQQYVRTSDALTRSVNAALARASQQAGAGYVDLYTPFESGSSATLTGLLAPDGDHPSAAGHQLIATTLLPYAERRG